MIKKEKELFEGNETIANNTFFMQIILFFMQIKKLLIDYLIFFSFFFQNNCSYYAICFCRLFKKKKLTEYSVIAYPKSAFCVIFLQHPIFYI